MLRQAILPALALATAALGSPVVRDYEPQLYRLRVSAPRDDSLDGRYLSLENNTVTLNILDGGFAEDALRFYTVESPAQSGKFELHTWPIGIVDHALGLVGDPERGFFAFQDVTNPQKDPDTGASTTRVGDQPAAWTQFTLGGGPVDPLTGEESNKLSFLSPERSHWAVFPGSRGTREVKWYDGTQPVIAAYLNVNITYEPAEKDAVVGPPIVKARSARN